MDRQPTYITAADNPGSVEVAIDAWRRHHPGLRVQRTTRLLNVLAGQVTVHVAVGWLDESPRRLAPPKGSP